MLVPGNGGSAPRTDTESRDVVYLTRVNQGVETRVSDAHLLAIRTSGPGKGKYGQQGW